MIAQLIYLQSVCSFCTVSCIRWVEILNQSPLPLEKWQWSQLICYRLGASNLIQILTTVSATQHQVQGSVYRRRD